MEEEVKFILSHLDDDPSRLLLSREKWPGIDISLVASTLESRKKIRGKLPSWYAVPTLIYPSPLSAEQSSSEPAACHKAAIVQGLFCQRKGDKIISGIADLTGGMGVDSWAFAGVTDEVLYNDMNAALVKAARHNFSELGVDNVRFSCREVAPGSISGILGDFKPDVVFLDPARRGTGGGKVFRLEDCSPNVLPLMPELLDVCPHVLLKLSPMADISLVARQLSGVREIHLFEAGGECKELLVHIERGWEGGYSINVGGQFSFSPEEETSATAAYAAPEKGQTLFEPGKALMKSGAFKLISSRFGLGKLAPSTHLYVADSIPQELAQLGKVFTVTDVIPFGKSGFRECVKLLPDGRAEVSSHNLRISSDQLRQKLGCKSGGNLHVFAADSVSGAWLIIASRN